LNSIIQGIDLFNDAEFFAAHDFFEDLWSESSKDQKFFFQGLVHVSVASFHLISGNLNGALSQYTKGRTKLGMYTPEYLGVDIADLIVSVEKIISEIENGGRNFSSENLVNRLPKIKYSK